MKSKVIIIAIIALLLLALIISIGQCSKNARNTTNWIARYDTLDKNFKYLVNQAGRPVAENKTAVFDGNQLNDISRPDFDLKKSEDKKVKKVKGYAKIQQQTALKDKFIPYDTVYLHDTVLLSPSDIISVPKKFHQQDKNYFVSGTVEKAGVRVDSLGLTDELSIRFVDKKQGWFKPSVATAQVVNTNPYVTITGLTTAEKKIKPSRWNKWIKPTLVGVGVGFITYKLVKK